MVQISNEYAVSLFRLASEQGRVAAYASCLDTVEQVVRDNPAYVTILCSPAIALQERLALIDAAFTSLSVIEVVSFLKLLCEKGHMQELLACVEEYRALVKAAENTIKATVYYAVPLSEVQQETLCRKLCEITQKTVEAVYVKDESLIGGVKVQIGDTVLDGSVAGRLNSIRGVMEQ